jgi:alpha-glucosidase
MERDERFVDFAAASGFPYFLIDAGWAYKSGPLQTAD